MEASTESLFADLVETRRIFAAAGSSPGFLESSELKTLQDQYSYPPEYGYDPDTLLRRGTGRATQLLSLPGVQQSESFLEIACSDGMVSCALSQADKRTTAIDADGASFDARASRAGVRLLEMDAADLQFDDDTMDFVFSYNAFEHFVAPEAVLREAIRVTRPGGSMYLEFGPLYYSPYGQHAYRSITVPYCHLLFSEVQINEFAGQNGLPLIDFTHVNGWSLKQYRRLWDKYSPVIDKAFYKESVDVTHLNLIRQYPSCFRSKSRHFEDFVVANISVLFRKSQSVPARLSGG